MTLEELMKATGARKEHAQALLPHIDATFEEFDICTAVRKAAFIAQISHESGRLRFTREIWGNTPAQQRYEGRADLGNTQKGDGFRFRGRGYLQTTGRANYRRTGQALGVDLEKNPELLEQPEWAIRSAGWFWKANGLNEIADTGDFKLLSKRINGGFNGLEDRFALWEKAKEVFDT